MSKRITGIVAAAALCVVPVLGLSACDSSQPAPHHKKTQASQAYSSDNQYYTRVYDTSANDWIWYMLILQNNQPYVSPTLPSSYTGIQWSRVASPPSMLSPTGQYVKSDSKGDPEEEATETEEEAQANGEETVDENTTADEVAADVDPDVDAPADSNGGDNSGSDSGGSDSGSSDSGGGGGDAGGGGDGGGGGGE